MRGRAPLMGAVRANVGASIARQSGRAMLAPTFPAPLAVSGYPSTSLPKMSSALNSSAISATITSAISTAAEAIFW